jgi:hypothetical protein
MHLNPLQYKMPLSITAETFYVKYFLEAIKILRSVKPFLFWVWQDYWVVKGRGGLSTAKK